MQESCYIVFENDINETAFNILNSAKHLYIDTETLGINIRRDRLCLMQITADNTNDVFLIRFAQNIRPYIFLEKLLNNHNIQKIFHYASFDMAVIQTYLTKIAIHNVACTKILSQFVRTFTDQHSLNSLCKDLLNTTRQYQSIDWSAPELTNEQKEFAANGALYLKSIFAMLYKDAVHQNKEHLVQSAFSMIPSLLNIAMSGYSLDIFSINFKL